MSLAGSGPCTYRLDASDTLVAYGGSWLAFARANGAPELEEALGRSVWDFIAGPTTRALYSVLFQRVRMHREPLTLPFRCDSPRLFRFMELDIAPAAPTAPADEGALDLAGRLLRVQARPYLPLLDRLASRSPSTLQLCSVCARTRLHGAPWMETETAVERLGLFGTSQPPRLEYTVCEDCCRQAEGHP